MSMTRKPRPRIDLSGRRFGMLVVNRIIGRTPLSKPVWSALCDCGNETLVLPSYVLSGDTKSCGCIRSAKTIARNIARTKCTRSARAREHSSWRAAIRRCTYPQDKDYPRYGAVGVTFCSAWVESFDSFYDHIGPRPEGTSLDRIDGSRGYEPGNVRWATAKLQAQNRKSSVYVELNGSKVPLMQAAEHFRVTTGAISKRIRTHGGLDGYHPRRTSKGKSKRLLNTEPDMAFLPCL